LWQPTTAKWFAMVFGGSVLYAIIRYHLVGDVEWRHFPVFILNKATSLAAVIFVAASYLIGKTIRWYDDDKRLRLVVIKFCGLMGFSLAGIHAVLALTIWTPAYFAKYFDEAGQLNLQGALGMVAGVVALFFLTSPAISTLPMMPKALGGKRWKRAAYPRRRAPGGAGFQGLVEAASMARLASVDQSPRLRRRGHPSRHSAQTDLRAAKAGNRSKLIAVGPRRVSSCQRIR
jgi:hypothetical protein